TRNDTTWTRYTSSLAAMPGVLTVGLINARNNYFVDWSTMADTRAGQPLINYVVAPGWQVDSLAAFRGTTIKSGTSMATPYVAGLAALLHQARPSYSAADIVRLICSTANPTGIRSNIPGNG